MLTVLYFARLREALGVEREALALPSPPATRALLAALRQRGGAWALELAEGRNFRVAVNQQVVAGDAPLADGDEVAIFPPVTGG